jgi:hypothetical protein
VEIQHFLQLDEKAGVDCHGTEHDFGPNFIKNSSICMGLGIIALRMKRCTSKTLLDRLTFLFRWRYTISYLWRKQYVWIVMEPTMVLAITSSKIVQFAWD